MKAFLTAAAMVMILAAPAYAQKDKPEDPVAAAEKRQAAEADRAYKNAIKNTAPAAPAAPSDPWANTREPAAKPK